MLEKMRLVHYVLVVLGLKLHTISANNLSHDLATTKTDELSEVHEGSCEEIMTDTHITFTNISEHGYSLEVHSITTEDGYILTVHRIPGPPGSMPVYLQHGLIVNSVAMLIRERNSLPIILSDQGYDVWLGNFRGNNYSRKHKTLCASDPKFWDFSFDEHGLYDIPAVINHISNITNKESLFYIGHSMAVSAFSIMAIERPDIAKQVKAVIALAPANFHFHIRTPFAWVSPFWSGIQGLMNFLGISKNLSQEQNLFTYFYKFCKLFMFGDFVCSNVMFLIVGFSRDQFDYSLLPKIYTAIPSGTSTKLLVHMLQLNGVDKFRKFDFGMQGNLKVYNSIEPPEYDISKMQVPIAVFWSENDWMVGKQDVKKFYNLVPIKLGIYKIDDEKFNHLDFLWGIDAPDLLYSKILDVLSQIK